MGSKSAASRASILKGRRGEGKGRGGQNQNKNKKNVLDRAISSWKITCVMGQIRGLLADLQSKRQDESNIIVLCNL
jgi:hypothetical protein